MTKKSEIEKLPRDPFGLIGATRYICKVRGVERLCESSPRHTALRFTSPCVSLAYREIVKKKNFISHFAHDEHEDSATTVRDNFIQTSGIVLHCRDTDARNAVRLVELCPLSFPAAYLGAILVSAY